MPKDKGYTISVVIPSKNSEKKIAACLVSIKDWADEIIVIDGTSIDRAVEIAKSFGAQVYSHAFLGSFAQERNFGIEKAKSDWVLELDTDEVVSQGFKKKCDEILPTTDYKAFKFLRKNTFLGHTFKYGGWYHYSQHLLRKGFAHYEGRVHEKMVVNGEVGVLEVEVLHFPFDNLSDFIDRQNRYTDLQAKDIIDSQPQLSIKEIKYNLTWKPLKLFKKMYLNKKGYKEGMYGFVFSVLFSWVHFLKWAKVWEFYKNQTEDQTCLPHGASCWTSG
jgi:glycosyltransferase involved in cell wall biosynthesis